MNIFEQASRKGTRFQMVKGLVTTEDLWKFDLETLDNLAVDYAKKLGETSSQSFIKTKTAANETLQLQFDIVKHIIDVKLKEKEDRKTRAEKQEKRELLQDLMKRKTIAELEGKSIEELQKEIDALD